MDAPVPTSQSAGAGAVMELKARKPELSVALVQRYLRTRAGKQSAGLAVTLGVSTVVTMSASSWGLAVAMGWSMVVAIVGTSFENYRRFFALDLPARSPAALVAPSDPVVEQLPTALRPIARELTSILSGLESIFEETFALFVSEESGSPMDEVNLHEFGVWLSRWDALDEEALAVAHARGFRLDELRGLLSRQLALESTAGDGMRLATGLVVAKAPPTDRKPRWWRRGGSAARKANHRALKSQVEHLRAVIVELRRLDDALHTDASQPYREREEGLARGLGLGGPREVCGRGARDSDPAARRLDGVSGVVAGWLARGPSGSHNGTMGRRAGPTGISTGVLGGRGWRWKLAAVIAGVTLTWTAFCPQDSPEEGDAVVATKDLVNRPWLNRMPTDERDTIFHLALLKHPKGRVGAAGHSSQWRHRIEVMRWRLKDGRLGVRFPQDGAKGELGVKTWRCGGEAPAPFDLCLEISNDDRAMTLYSREDWEFRVDPKSGALAAPASPALLPAHAAFDMADVVPLLGAPVSAASAPASALDPMTRLLDGAR